MSSWRSTLELFTVDQLHSRGLGPVNLHLNAGECVFLSGPSGSGKTRLLRAIADLDEHAGEVHLAGVACRATSAPVWRRQVGLLCAESRWWTPRVGDHFTARLDASMLAEVGFDKDVFEWRIERMSSGERQRLALLRLLAQGPRVLLLDEPTANLDPANVARVETLLAKYRKEHDAAFLWVSHDPIQIARLADRLLIIESGRLRDGKVSAQ